MIVLALLLLAIGAADLVRPQDRAAPMVALIRALTVGAALLALGIGGTGLPWWWLPLGLLAVVGWVVSTPTSALVRHSYVWPLLGLGVAVLAILAASSQVQPPDGWLTRWFHSLRLPVLDGVSFDRFALAVGCLVFLVETANIIVRMVLTGTDAGVMESEQTLKGGRVLGPLERIFIFAMALSGAYVALTAVVAAKGILRFPEISRDVAGRKAEYVLVGSFVSWSIALVFIPLM